MPLTGTINGAKKKRYFRLIVALLISLAITSLLIPGFCLISYIHEGGHILFGYIGSYLTYGEFGRIGISNYVACPAFPFWDIPQQAKVFEGTPTVLFTLGGPFLVIILIATLGGYVYVKYKGNRLRYLIITLAITMCLFEVFADSLCGTDKLNTSASWFCGEAKNPIGIILMTLVMAQVYTLIFYLYVKYRENRLQRLIITLK